MSEKVKIQKLEDISQINHQIACEVENIKTLCETYDKHKENLEDYEHKNFISMVYRLIDTLNNEIREEYYKIEDFISKYKETKHKQRGIQ